MEQPLTRDDPASDGLAHDEPAHDGSGHDASAHDALSKAAGRLDRAVASLEAALARRSDEPPVGADPADAAPEDAALRGELQAARVREASLQDAAAVASQALGRAMAEVRLALQADESGDGEERVGEASGQGRLDLALEPAPQSPEDGPTGGAAAPGEEPAA